MTSQLTDKNLSGQKIGYVGLGNMGRAMARHLHATGADVVVWNRSTGPAEAAVAAGMRCAATLPELAREIGGGIICLNLTTAEVVEQVLLGQGGLIEGLQPGALLIDFGTTGLPATKKFAEHVTWVDAPVSGGQVGAEAATLTIMAGGSEAAFQRALPVLRVVGRNVTHLGPVGSGQVTKLANQLIVAQTIDAVAQALRLAELAGVDSAKVREALLGGFADSRILQLHGDRMVRRDFVPGGRSALQLKDVRLICELAASLGFQSPTLDNCRAQWERMVEKEGLGDVDHSGLFMLYDK
ncbi:2-hydroxy-3-oxopropionate reductase [Chthoniobacter flavus Ellin428]|uniref:2-hydroxy-3-oxopropionate reductase n=1 Tax=Chthoniobacter flavus Ellin428 TaxID=497964 RepID=B4D578_9BACT|nr:NAD(P)-dependent oxidoreductase [Chthoniobacter flavus]EDY18283.1 2-hydroxy-3-oxopropionate reductase [Chthoniobacter flavus Ellin428]TCO91311.1 2-hydroxy-3-oxopropionate reductase [Chthoniobacter flavus]